MVLIAVPDPLVMARKIAEDGYRSCDEAEKAGCFVTPHSQTRAMVDSILADYFASTV